MKALFVTYGGGHVSMVLPVMHQLRLQHPDVECVLLALTTAHARALRAGEAALGYRDFMHLADAEAAMRWGQQLHGGNSSPDVTEAESIAYLGINYLDLVAQHGEQGAAALYASQGRYAFLPLHFMRRLLDAVQPNVVVATNSPRSEQAALQVAVERGVPTVGMVDLFGTDHDSYVWRAIKPHCTCVIAATVRDRLLAHGFPESGVAVTGNPAFDGLFNPSVPVQAQAVLEKNGWLGKSVILYAGTWESKAHPDSDVPVGRSFPMAVESILRDYVRDRTDTVLIIRFHPGDWFEYPRQPEQARVHFSEPPNEPIHPLILAASVVVTTNSTVGLEAAVAGRVVISVENSPTVMSTFSLAEQGVSYPCATHLDLPAVLDKVLAHPVPRLAFRSDGQAAVRVAQVVARAANSGR